MPSLGSTVQRDLLCTCNARQQVNSEDILGFPSAHVKAFYTSNGWHCRTQHQRQTLVLQVKASGCLLAVFKKQFDF